MAKKKAPELRFKGFEGEWEERTLGEMGDTYVGLSGKSKDDFGHGEGKYITYLNVFSNPITDPNQVESIEIDKIQNTVISGDVFFTTSSETPEEVGMSSVLLADCSNTYLNSFCFGYRLTQLIDKHYLAYMLRTPPIRKKIAFLAQGISRYNISKNRVMEIRVPTPSLGEQKALGTYFKNLDSLIALHQRKHDKLLTVKKAMLEKLFPKEGADVPEIRFKGFTGKWMDNRMDHIYKRIKNAFVGTASVYYAKSGYFYLESNNVKNGEMNRINEVFINEKFYKMQKDNWLHTGDLVMVQSGHVGHSAVIPSSLNNSVAHALIMFTNPKERVNPYFINYQVQNTVSMKKIEMITKGNTIRHILSSDMKEFIVSVPSHAEQDKIAAFFQRLDSLISLHARELDKLKNIKKACLEKMFI